MSKIAFAVKVQILDKRWQIDKLISNPQNNFPKNHNKNSNEILSSLTLKFIKVP